MIPTSDRYWLKNAHVPASFLEGLTIYSTTRDGLCLVDLEVRDGKIATILKANTVLIPEEIPVLDLRKKILLPWFVDLHTHLDKGHIWERSPNPDGTFDSALTTVQQDAQKFWNREDVYRRMEFGIKCSYAHGTQAIRTHIDSFGKLGTISWNVFKTLQQKWVDRITLQAVSLVTLDYYQTAVGRTLVNQIAEVGGILGGVVYMNSDLPTQLDTVFSLAKKYHLDLDFHADETKDPSSCCLAEIAKAALRHNFPGQIICGHCCSLASQSDSTVDRTLNLVKNAGIAIVSLPMCNLYLQDRQKECTPKWRGVTLVHELKHRGIPVTFASDNCRDPFYGFGDHDGLEVFAQAVRIAHLDIPYGDWINSVTTTPADLMGLSSIGRIQRGKPANLILYKARYFSELLSRPHHDRILVQNGRQIHALIPDYDELHF